MQVSFNIDDLHDVGLVGGVFFVAVYAHNFLARLYEVLLFGNFHASLDNVVGSQIAFNLVAPNTTGNLQLSDNS